MAKNGYVTGLENKDWDPDNITSGRAATEDQLQKSHKSLDNKINNLGDEITKKGIISPVIQVNSTVI